MLPIFIMVVVCAGDFNNDGLQDVYFTGNLVSNKLYLNKGKIKFEDITAEAGVEGKKEDGAEELLWWISTTMVGRICMYVCLWNKDPSKRQNLLYINQGLIKMEFRILKRWLLNMD